MTTTAPRGTERRNTNQDSKTPSDGRRSGGRRLLTAGAGALLAGLLLRRRRNGATAEAAAEVKLVAPKRKRELRSGAAWRPGRGTRAAIRARTLRTDRWWVQPAVTFGLLFLFVAYSTFRAFANGYYYSEPYISPFYSPCLAGNCAGSTFPKLWPGWTFVSPALYVLIFPLGFRLSCYYYRKAYYRSFWLSPPACAVAEPHKTYTGETRLPLLGQNVHRYFFYFALIFNVILTYDAVLAFRDQHGAWGHMGLGSLVLVANAVLLWLYTLSCHSCRHIVGGRLNNFSKHPLRYRYWNVVSKLNARHMQYAWVSLFGVAFADLYVYLLALGTFSDPRFF